MKHLYRTLFVLFFAAPVFAIGPITGNFNICRGLTSPVADTTAGGTWSCSNTTIATVGTSSGIVSAASPGTATITYTTGAGYVTASIIVNALPVAYSTAGGGGYCSGSAGVHITLAGSDIGVDYTLYNSTVVVAGPIAGTGSALDFGLMTAGGTYTAKATNLLTGCNSNMTGSATVTVYPLPVAYRVIGGGHLCPSGVGADVLLSGSSIGNDYQLYLGTIPVGAPVAAWGGMVDFGPQTMPGIYKARGFDAMTGCMNIMADSARIVLDTTSSITLQQVINPADTICHSPDFYIRVCGVSPTLNVVSLFGDGTTDTTAVAAGVSHIYHAYAAPGTYAVKQFVFDTTTVQDSISFSYDYNVCSAFQVKLFLDSDHDCVFDTSEAALNYPVTLAVDSNGVRIDTISTTSGFFYKATGPVGTIYAFRMLSIPSGLHVTCPATGVVYDTVQVVVNNYGVQYFGLECTTSGTSYDLAEVVTENVTQTWVTGSVAVSNTYCNPAVAVVTMKISPRYLFWSSYPAPTSVVGSTVTWNLGLVSAYAVPPVINYMLYAPFPLSAGDTVHTEFILSRGTGDIDTSNNYVFRIDTVRASHDPNEITVSPEGNVLSCAKLQYTVQFENTGNDTAHNIYVMDTLSSYLDVRSLEIVSATAPMNTVVLRGGGYTVVKFDFPRINLPDSTHHNQCHGQVTYRIKAKPGLATGAIIRNYAGIYFDYNPAVMTNVATNTIGINPINGPDSVCVASGIYLSDATPGGVWSMSNARATVTAGLVHGTTAGLDTLRYMVSNSCESRTATKTISINPLADAGTITGGHNVCAGNAVTLADAVSGGVWSSSSPAIASIGGTGVVHGIAPGTLVISYHVTTTCGAANATNTFSVNMLPAVFTVTGGGAYCAGDTGVHVRVSGSATGINYQLFAGSAPVGSILGGTGSMLDMGLLTAAGTYTVSAQNAATTCVSSMASAATVTINATPPQDTVTGGGGYCAGGGGVHIGLGHSSTGMSYQLYRGTVLTGGAVGGTGGPLDFGVLATAGTYTVLARNAVTGCHSNMIAAATVAIDPLPAIEVVNGGGGYCAGDAGAVVGLGGSATGIDYRLQLAGSPVGTAVSGTGSGISFGSQPLAGTYTVMAAYTATGCSAPMAGSAVVSIVPVVIPAITIVPDAGDTVCTGVAVMFSASIVNGGTAPAFSWYVNGTLLGGAGSFGYVPNDNDIVQGTLISNAGCARPATVSSAVHMAVLPALIPIVTISNDPLVAVKNAPVTFTTAVVNGGTAPTYQWLIDNSPVGGATNATYTTSELADGDSVSCIVTSDGLCGGYATFNSVVVAVGAEGVGGIAGGNRWSIYPNPNHGEFAIKGKLSSKKDDVRLRIVDVLGRGVYSGTAQIVNGEISEVIKLGAVAPGTYMLEISGSDGKLVYRVAVE